MTVTRAQVIALPKAELHLHIEGTLEPELAFELAARNGVTLSYRDVQALRGAYSFSDLGSFLGLYYECMAVLRTAEDFADLASAYLARARADGVTRVEMFFDPQVHLSRGVPLTEVIGGLRAGADRSAVAGGPQVGLIPCFLRDRGPDDAAKTLEELAPTPASCWPSGSTRPRSATRPPTSPASSTPPAASDCTRSPTRGRKARRTTSGRRSTCSAWSASTTASAASRIPPCSGGSRADRTPLTVCPLSNVRLRCVPSIAEHPLPTLLDAGVNVTINSDDPAYFGGYVADNYLAIASGLGLDLSTVTALAANSLNASLS